MPKIVDRAQKQEEILEAAGRIFARDGFQGATLQAIANEAGVGKATLYYYFDSKRDIVRALLEQERLTLEEVLNRSLLGANPGIEELERYAIARLTHVRDRIRGAQISDENLKELLPVFWSERQVLHHLLEERLRLILQRGVDAHALAVEDVELTARVIDVAMRSLLLEFYRRDDPDLLLRAARILIKCLRGRILPGGCSTTTASTH
ncbi:MAG: TetR/AcrR family transcriptional regulator [Myxococcales bacterium]|nr:TetR/AcrR family transcriptional regulator [Myxococcales bacterium]